MINKTNFEIDTLTELASIGAGNASRSIAVMTSKQVTTNVPVVSTLILESVSSKIKQKDNISTAVVLKINHQISGVFLILLSPPKVVELCQLIDPNSIHQNHDDILKELGNILCGTAINSLSSFLHIDISQSVPAIATDSPAAIIQSIVAELGEKHQEILLFETGFIVDNLELDIFYLFDPQSTDFILKNAQSH